MHQRFIQRQVGIPQIHVLAHHRDVDGCLRVSLGINHLLPFMQISWRGINVQFAHHNVVKMLFVQQLWNLVNIIGVYGRNHRTLFHIGKQGDLAALFIRNGITAPAQQDIGLDTDGAQLLHRVLGRLGLDLTRGGNVGHQRQVHVKHIVMTELDAKLTDGLQKRQ